MGYATQAVMEAKKVALEVLEFALDLKAEEQCSKVRARWGRRCCCEAGRGRRGMCLYGRQRHMLSTTYPYALGRMYRTMHGRSSDCSDGGRSPCCLHISHCRAKASLPWRSLISTVATAPCAGMALIALPACSHAWLRTLMHVHVQVFGEFARWFVSPERQELEEEASHKLWANAGRAAM